MTTKRRKPLEKIQKPEIFKTTFLYYRLSSHDQTMEDVKHDIENEDILHFISEDSLGSFNYAIYGCYKYRDEDGKMTYFTKVPTARISIKSNKKYRILAVSERPQKFDKHVSEISFKDFTEKYTTENESKFSVLKWDKFTINWDELKKEYDAIYFGNIHPSKMQYRTTITILNKEIIKDIEYLSAGDDLIY